jgi:acetyl-CoA acetyltransferase
MVLDMDVAGVYDCFTGTVIMMLEDLGFARKAKADASLPTGT